MSTKLSLLVISLTILLFGCRKTQTQNDSTINLISQAHAFFDKFIAGSSKSVNTSNYRANQPRSPLWDQAALVHLPEGDLVSVPISYRNNIFVSSKTTSNLAYRLSDITSLVITRDSANNFHTAVVTYVPDTSSGQGVSPGLYFVEDWEGNTIYSPIQIGAQANGPSTNTKTPSNTKESDYTQSIQVCNVIYGYNYSVDDPDNGVSWSETSCIMYGLSVPGAGAGIPISRLPALPTLRPLRTFELTLAPPTSPIQSIADYFKCFTNSASPDHTYSVQVCVDQPSPGTRQPWTLTPDGPGGTSATGNPLNVGHTFLVLTENDQGNIITRNVGFYPATIVYPLTGYTSGQGVLNDDDGHQYNISLTINVSATQFSGILNYVSLGNNTGFYYDLNNDNCTTFVINALGANGISLPNTKGSWSGGGGNDPGDLGEDISQMQLGPNMTRNTVSSPHPNVGTCN